MTNVNLGALEPQNILEMLSMLGSTSDDYIQKIAKQIWDKSIKRSIFYGYQLIGGHANSHINGGEFDRTKLQHSFFINEEPALEYFTSLLDSQEGRDALDKLGNEEADKVTITKLYPEGVTTLIHHGSDIHPCLYEGGNYPVYDCMESSKYLNITYVLYCREGEVHLQTMYPSI